MRYFTQILFFLISLISNNLFADQIGIATGREGGSYFAIGGNLQEFARALNQGIDINIHRTEGAIENTTHVYKTHGIQLGLAQTDVLAFLKTSQNDEFKRLASKIKLVFPLFISQLHVLANDKIITLSDLKGRTVAIDSPGSGTHLTTKVVLDFLKITPVFVEKGGKEALNDLLEGKIDAMFYNVTAPANLFTDKRIGERHLHLLPVIEKEVTDSYIVTTIPANTYPWQQTEIKTVGNKAVLMTYDYPLNHPKCQQVGRFAKMVQDNQGWLKEKGHNVWKTINLDEIPNGWERSLCVINALKGNNVSQDIKIQLYDEIGKFNQK